MVNPDDICVLFVSWARQRQEFRLAEVIAASKTLHDAAGLLRLAEHHPDRAKLIERAEVMMRAGELGIRCALGGQHG